MENNKQPLVSVVIACYNHEHFVQDCIQSVIDQTYENIELIIIDDGSKDGSVEKIQEMIFACERRFKRFEFRYRPNKGLSRTLNEALVWCEGEYYSPFASDDIMCANKIEIQANFLIQNSDSSIAGVFGGYYLIDESNKTIKTIVKKEKKYHFDEIFLHNFSLPAPTALLILENVRSIGGYKENLKIEDWYMWLKLTENHKSLVYLNTVLVKYRSHDINFSKNFKIMNEERKKVIDCFSHSNKYNMARLKVEWLKATDYLYVDKTQSIVYLLKLLKCDIKQIVTMSFVKYFFHAFKSFIK
ncbi:glycosyltransferase [Acinetobacter johnsonii]|uniref:glycosyltransferase n=1 Tax=Acinetobacter johnsonii TaxID=40214 RepID=UPI003AF6B4F7